MIEYVNQLGADGPVIGPAPTGTDALVWSLDTTAHILGGHRTQDALTVLDAGEREKAARLRLPGLRHRYLAAHLGVRVLLGGYLGLSPQAVPLTREDCPCCGEPHGRPAVTGNPLHFSLSHTGDIAYIALAALPVGVDIEKTPSPETVADVIRSLHPDETAELGALPPAERPEALARLWSRKEACLKATGTGLALGLVHPYVGTRPTPPHLADFTLVDLPAPDDHAAALALTHPGSTPGHGAG
ncbi:4'-phosphopantetheinyl transferase family protein [Streptomyces sp. NPDC085639]|uniref:4'-phosphopantetheinyl transferase family protein n=1 Tax=Streptomyces sp. NPDC085639 TaxID=3365734 RepID=UPI0037CEB5DE